MLIDVNVEFFFNFYYYYYYFVLSIRALSKHAPEVYLKVRWLLKGCGVKLQCVLITSAVTSVVLCIEQ